MNNYQKFAELFHQRMSSNPLELSDKEDFNRFDELPDISAEAIEDDVRQNVELADRIAEADFSDSTFDERLEMELAENLLRASEYVETASTGGSPRYAVRPNALLNLLGLTSIFLERDQQDKSNIVDGFCRRMEQMPEYLAQGLERLDRPVAAWAKQEIECGEGFEGIAEGLEKFASQIGYRKMGNLHSSVETARESLRSYLAALGEMETRQEVSVGSDSAANWFRHLGVLVPPKKMHELAMTHLDQTMENLGRTRKELIAKYDLSADSTVLEVAEALKTRFASPQGEVVEFARGIADRAREFAYEHGLVTRLKNASTSIESTPDYLRPIIPIAAMLPPGSFAKGEKRSTFYVSEFEGIETALNQLNLPGIAGHELIPGHAYQFTRAREHPSLIRAWTSPMDTAEAWTTYVAEELMQTMGYSGNDELATEEQFMNDVDQLRLGGRVCFVLACLTGDRTYFENSLGVEVRSPDILDASTELYSGITGFTESRARGDVDLFSRLGTYGALYLVGNSLIKGMEQRASEKQGDRFSQVDFLESVLREGNMPLSYIEKSLEHKGVL